MSSDLGELSPDGTAIRFDRAMPAPPEEVWRALTDPARLPAWLSEVDLLPQGRVTVRMSKPVDVLITHCGGHRLTVDWAFPGEPVTELSAAVGQADGATVLTLTQTGLDPAGGGRYRTAWHVHLDLLVAHLAGRPGVDFMQRYAEVKELYRAG